MSYLQALKSNQVATQGARTAIRAFKLREFPERHELTEKSLFARVEGRPNDEDLVVPIHIGWGRQDSARWALMSKGLVLSTKGSVIFRNELEHDLFDRTGQVEVEGDRFSFNLRGEVDPQGKFHNVLDLLAKQDELPAKVDKLVTFMNPEQDALDEMNTACTQELGRAPRVFFFDRRSVGASQFARQQLDLVTNCKHTAQVLGDMLSQTPASSGIKTRKQTAALTVMHCSYRDPELSPAVDTYAAVSANKIVARGQFEFADMLELVAGLASKPLLQQPNSSLVMRGNVLKHRDGQVELVLGAPAPTAAAGVDASLQAAHHFVWGYDGVTRAWDAVLAGRSTLPLKGEPQTLLPQPTKITFAKQSGVKAQDGVKAALEKALIVGNVPTQSVALFEKLVKDHNITVAFEK